MIDKGQLAGKSEAEICAVLQEICDDLNSVIQVCAVEGIEVELEQTDTTTVEHAARCVFFTPIATKILLGHLR